MANRVQCILAVFLLACLASASHFRYASIQWQQTSALTVTFTIFTAWDGNAQNPSFNLAFGDGQYTGNILGSSAASIDQFGGYNVYQVSNLNHTYPSAGPWTASINACCRDDALLNVQTLGVRYIVSSTIYCDAYIFRRSPVSMLPPVVQFQQQTVNSLQIPIVYPDGLVSSTFSCSFSSTSASGIPLNPPFSASAGTSLSLSNDGNGGCTLNWNLTSTSQIEGYAVQVTIASPINSISISLDFIIGVVPPGDYSCDFATNNNLLLLCSVGSPCAGNTINWQPTTPNNEVFVIDAIPSNTYGFPLSPPSGRAVGPGITSYATSVGLASFIFATQVPYGVNNIQCAQNCDDYCLPNVQIGFTFQYYGNDYSVVSLSSNGVLYFGSSCLSPDDVPRPIPDGSAGNFVAALWADLTPVPSTWWYQTITNGTQGIFLFTFENATYFEDTTTVQVQLRLYNNSNLIEVHLYSAPAERQNKPRSIGIEDAGGTIGIQSYYGPASIIGIAYAYVPYDDTIVQLQVAAPQLTYPNAYVGYVLFEDQTPCVFSSYISQAIPVDFVSHELVPLATNLSVCDDCCGPYTTIGFDFVFFGADQSAITPESNGFLTVADDCQSLLPNEAINSGIPSPQPPNQMVAVQLADLDVITPGSWWLSTIGQAPNRVFLLTYEGVGYFELSPSITTTCQIKLFETTSVIEVHIVNAPASGVLKTVGIENGNGTVGIQSLRTPLPIVATAFRYTPICSRRDIYCPYTIATTRNCNLAVTPQITAPTCSNGANGQIVLQVTTQYPPVTYNWIGQNYSSTGTFVGPAGSYSVVVTDNGNCQQRLNLTIPAAAAAAPYAVTAIGVNPVCAGTGQAIYQSSGVVASITWFGSGLPAGGTPGLTRPNPVSVATLGNGTFFGRATFPVQISGACYDTNTITLTGASQPLTASLQYTNVSCYGQNTASASVTPQGGLSPYNVTWSGGPVVVPPGASVTNLIVGSYNYTVIDSAGCKLGPVQVNISQPSQIVVSSVSAVTPTCFNRQDGSLTFNVTGGVGSYTISWLDYDTDLNSICCLSRNYLGAGTYRLQVTDSNQCNASGVGVVPPYTGALPCLRARRNPNGPCNGVTSCP